MKQVFKHLITVILCFEARLVLVRHKPKIVAVIGSVGKTSTKDAIYTALSRKFFVRRSEKSFNSDVGVPLTVLGLRNAWSNPIEWLGNIFRGLFASVAGGSYPEWLVLELGVDRPGDMRRMAEWIRPDIVVITRFAEVPVHVEFFSTPEAVIKEKCQILQSLKKDGLLVLNADDPRVLAVRDLWGGKTSTYGFSEKADCRVSDFSLMHGEGEDGKSKPRGVSFHIIKEHADIPVTVWGTIGKSIGGSIAAATAVALSQGLSAEKIVEAFGKFSPPPGRMRLLRGVKNTLIIDDSYNSSPVAAEHALETLSQIEWRGRKIAVLGDMLELGKYSVEAHRNIGKLVSAMCDILITVGIRARDIAEGALDAGMKDDNIYQFDDSAEAGKYVQNEMKEGDIILVKGSQGVRTERVVEEIMADPEKKGELLVRQAAEWERR